MKSIIKRQMKRSFSLFLAVLMMLSCWVWVAPEKAEAGAPDNYTVTISFDVEDACNGGEVRADVTHLAGNGTGAETKTSWALDKCESDTGTYSLSKNFAGWPGKIYVLVDQGGVRTQNIKITSIAINGRTVLSGEWTLDPGHWGSEDRTFVPDTYANALSDGKSGMVGSAAEGTWDWPRPVLDGATAELDVSTHELNKVNTGINSESKLTLGGLVDTYGVNWTGTLDTSFNIRTSGDVIPGTNVTATPSGYGGTIVIKPWFQTLYPGKQSAQIYVDWSAKGGTVTKTGTEIIDILFPTYTATFYGNGGKISLDDSLSTTEVIFEGESLTIGSPIGTAPYYASKPGFELMGFYSKVNQDKPGIEANFTGSKFEDTITTVPHTAGPDYGYDSDERPFYGDTKWYAAWQASPLAVTFVTQDGQLIATLTGRYNNYLTNSNMFNGLTGLNTAVKAAYKGTSIEFDSNNAPVYRDGSTTYTFDGWKIIAADNLAAYDGIVDMNGDGKVDENDKDNVVDGLKESPIDKDEDFILRGDVTLQATYKVASAEKYSVYFEDGNNNKYSIVDKNGNAVGDKYYSYRDDVILPSDTPSKEQDVVNSYEFIGWAKDIGKDFYAVDENDCDETGAKIVYTHKDAAELVAKSDVTYVPVFRMIPCEYSVTFNYMVDGIPETLVVGGYNWHDTPVKPDVIPDNYVAGKYRQFLTGWKIDGVGASLQLDKILVEGNMSITADYGNREVTTFTINFLDKDGNLINADNNIFEYNDAIVPPSVGDGEGYDIPQTIKTDYAYYEFKEWSPRLATTARKDTTYQAIYTEKVYTDLHFYNYDGTLIYEWDGQEHSLFVGDKIPAYENLVEKEDTPGEYENVLPTKPGDVVGTYEFIGWRDSTGTVVEPGKDVLKAENHLIAEFNTIYKEYTVKFVNDVLDENGDKIVISEEKYHYGDEIEVPADPSKAEDVEYIYDFKAWTPDVSTVCYGDATYEASYRRTPQYYKVTWLKDDKTVLSESNYIYNARIHQAIINAPVSYGPADAGNTWVLDYWVQCDKNGNNILVDGEKVIFEYGQRMGAEDLYFYPVFKQVTNVLKVTFYKEDGTSLLGVANIPYGDNIADYADEFAVKAPKEPDETNHYIIKEWVENVENGEVVTTITSDIAVKATYTSEAHNKVLYEVVAEPTCNVPGYAHFKCEAAECTAIDYNRPIAPVADEGKPTGQFYVGNNKWTLEDFENGIDYDDVKFVGPNTYVVVNAEDTGTRSMPWNLEAKLNRGVGKIEYSVQDGKVDNPAGIADWTTVYDYEEFRQDALDVVLAEKKITALEYIGYSSSRLPEDMMKKAEIDRAVDALLSAYNSNATGVLSNLNLVDGETYIIYIKISDREGLGEANVCYLSSGTISYGTKAPVITVTGEGYGTKFCEKATVAVTDDTDGFVVYLDGKEVELTDGKFTCNTEGIHNVTAIDKHGNKTTKAVEIKGSHSYRNYTIAATCEAAGSTYDVCTVCQAKTEEEAIPAIGHEYTINFIDKLPTCAADGSRTYICNHNCGTKLVLDYTYDGGYLDPEKLAQVKRWDETANDGEGAWVTLTALDLKHLESTGAHTYEKVKDAEGKDTIDDKWIIDKEATCKAEGSKHKDCTKCGIIGRVTEVIPVDTENGHKFYREKVTKEPTCTEKGEKGKTCRYCGHVEKTVEIDALGHEAGEYITIQPATCTTPGSEMLTCSRCGIYIGEGEFDPEKGAVAKEIPALGHKWKLEGEPFEKDVAAEDGQVSKVYHQKYVCEVCGESEDRPLDGYKPPIPATVTFNFNGGYYVIPAVGTEGSEGYVAEKQEATQTINAMVGDSIIATDIEKAVKDSDKTYHYSFSHWATKDELGNYTKVEFPIEVKGDETFYAVYAEKYVNYEVRYYREDNSEFKVTGYHHNGDTIDFIPAPTKDGFKFAGWGIKVKVPDGNNGEIEIVEVQDIVKINGENVNLFAVYEKYPVYYIVTYAYSEAEEDVIERFGVLEGGYARDCGIVPVKAPDKLGHYEFISWDKAADLVIVKENIYALPIFETIPHDYDKTIKTEPTCTNDAIYTYTCKECGYTFDEAEENSALGHKFEGEWLTDENGNKYRICQREGCDARETADATTYTITYYNADGSVYVTSKAIPENAALKDYILRDGPAKDMDETYTYEFIGWASKDDVNSIPLTVAGDLELVPVYESTKRTYKVIFAYDGKNIIEEVEVKAGEKAECSKEAIKAYDADKHYVFDKWSKADKLNAVYSDIYTTAEFTAEAHNAIKTKTVAATCYANAVETYTCECGYSYEKVVIGSAGHTWVDGVCSVCGITTGGSTVSYKLAYYTDSGKAYRYSYNIPAGAKLAEIVLAYGPEKSADKDNTYTFDSWLVYSKDASGNVTKEPITDSMEVAGNVALYPKYDANIRKYKVIFAYDAENVIAEGTVDAGSAATCATTPKKDADSKYHYTFREWNRSYELEEVFSDIYTTPIFNAVGHTFTKSETPATCETLKKVTYTCTCGYSYTVEVPNSFADHTWGEGVDNGQGKLVYTCTVCGETKGDTATYKVEYYVDGNLVATENDVAYGTKLSTLLDKKVTKDADETNTYAFKGWLIDGEKPAADAEVKGNVKLDAEFETTKRTYVVVFAYNAQNVIEAIEVKAGEKAVCTEKVEKAYDDVYHYIFKGWNKADELDAVYGNIYTTPLFDAVSHKYIEAEIDATCYEDKKITYTCECGHSYTETIAGTKGHKWEETTDAAGNKIKKCTVCGETTTEGLKFTISYYVDNKLVSTKANVEYGTKLAEILSTSKPSKDTDNYYVYTFSEWKIDGSTSVGDTLVTRDIALHAVYNRTDRLYTVMFGYSANNMIEDEKATITGVKYGEISSSLYKLADPTKAYDSEYHYTFKGWKDPIIGKDGNTYIYYADFNNIKHSKYVDEDASVDATCTHGPSIVTKCTGCAYVELDQTGKPLPHNYKSETIAPENGKDGKIIYTCQNDGCTESYEEIIKWEDPESEYVTITVVVKENGQNNAPVKNAKVDLYSGNTWIKTEYTNDDGIVKFKVPKGTYRAIVSGVQGAGTTEFTINAEKDGQTVESPKISIKHCGCACHNTSIWGKIFRFFHKIIKSFTGEFKCCADPSHLYN